MDRPYHHGDLRRALTEAAVETVRAEGADALTLRAVATRAGVSVMAPYRHFPDKAALEAAVAEHGFGLLRARMARAGHLADPRQRLVEQGVAYVLFADQEPGLFRLMFGRAPHAGRRASEDLAGDPGTVYGAFAAELSAIFPAEEVDLARLTAWSFIHGLAALVVDRRISPFPADIEATVRQAAQFLIARLAPGAEPGPSPRQADV